MRAIFLTGSILERGRVFESASLARCRRSCPDSAHRARPAAPWLSRGDVAFVVATGRSAAAHDLTLQWGSRRRRSGRRRSCSPV